ncbi:MAG: serine hydrolase [Pseudomonadota bacterium]
MKKHAPAAHKPAHGAAKAGKKAHAPAKVKAPEPPAESFADLLRTGAHPDATEWNGMKVFAMDPVTGSVLINAAGDAPHDPASLTKMLTFEGVMLKIKAGKLTLTGKLIVPPEAGRKTKENGWVGIEGSHLTAGSEVSVSELLGAMMTASDNGASLMLANRIWGNDCVAQMNALAKDIGLKNTKFVNPHGLPYDAAKNTTTARDMATLIQRVQKDFPNEMQAYMGQASVTYDGKTRGAHHFLNNPESAVHLKDGYTAAAKTGLTKAAQNNLAAVVTHDKRDVVVVVLGASSPTRAIAAESMSSQIYKDLQHEKNGNRGNRHASGLAAKLAATFLDDKAPTIAASIPAPTAKVEAKPAPAKPAAPAPAPVVAAAPAPVPAKAPPAAPAQAPVAAAPHSEKPAAAAIVQSFSAADLKAVAACTKALGKSTNKLPQRPGPETSAKPELLDAPINVTTADKALHRYVAEKEKTLASIKGTDSKSEAKKAAIRQSIAPVKKLLQDGLRPTLEGLENQSNPNLYTQANYEAQITRGQEYTNAFVDTWTGPLPKGGKEALRQTLSAIIAGTAGMETGWNVDTVKGGAKRRPHSGVFQTEWRYIADAAEQIKNNPAMAAVLEKHPEDAKVLALGKPLSVVRGLELPTTSFAGQGASAGAMAVASYVRFVEQKKQNPNDFSGVIVYHDHLMGATGALKQRNRLAADPNKLVQTPDATGTPIMTKAAYDDNYMNVNNPYTQSNDLNRRRVMYADAKASDVQEMMHFKLVHARNKLVNKSTAITETLKKLEETYPLERKKLAEANPAKLKEFDGAFELERKNLTGKFNAITTHLKEFEEAFLPEWTKNPELKKFESELVQHLKDSGLQARAKAEQDVGGLQKAKAPRGEQAQALCNILQPIPMPPKKSMTIAGR